MSTDARDDLKKQLGIGATEPAISDQAPPFWDDDPISWDNVVLGGDICPGLTNKIEGLTGGKRKTDIKTGQGADGATIVDKGYEPATWTLVFEIYKRQELAELKTMLASIRPKIESKVKAFTVYHPMLDLLAVSSCYVLDIKLEKAQGILTAKLTCIEFLPVQTANASGKVKQKSSSIEETFAAVTPTKDPQGIVASRSLPSTTIRAPKP